MVLPEVSSKRISRESGMKGAFGGGRRRRRERERWKERELGTAGLLKEDIGVDARLDVVSHVAGSDHHLQSITTCTLFSKVHNASYLKIHNIKECRQVDVSTPSHTHTHTSMCTDIVGVLQVLDYEALGCEKRVAVLSRVCVWKLHAANCRCAVAWHYAWAVVRKLHTGFPTERKLHAASPCVGRAQCKLHTASHAAEG